MNTRNKTQKIKRSLPLRFGEREINLDKRVCQRGMLIFLLVAFLLVCLGSIRHKSFTTDELKHYRYGVNILNFDATRFDDSKMPFSALNALPAKIAPYVPVDRVRVFLQKPQTGRIITILFSLGVAYLIFRWSRSLYGIVPGLFSLFLYVFDPNIIAHSRLITTDIYATGMAALAIYTFWLFSEKRNWKYAALSAFTLGLSQLAKYTSAYLYPILFAIVIIRDLPVWIDAIRNKDYRAVGKFIKAGAKRAIFFLVISIFIINVGFLFQRTFTPLGKYVFRSELFQTVQVKLSPLGFMPVPVPYPYVEGLDWVQARERTGAGYGSLYMLGELRGGGENFKGYYIFASLLKLPIAAQIILLLAMVKFFKDWKKHYRNNAPPFSSSRHSWKRHCRNNSPPSSSPRHGGRVSQLPHVVGGLRGVGSERLQHHFIERELFLFVPAAFFFFYFNFIFRAQIGMRFYLVLFPFLYVLAGSLVKDWRSCSTGKKSTVIILGIWLLGSVLLSFPHYIPYFNAFVGDRRYAYEYLVDSNLDWEQAEWYLDQYLYAHPEATFEPGRPTLGTIVVSPNKLVGIEGPPDRFLWLREYFEPEETIADVYLVYEIAEEAYNQVRDQIEE
ncbi:MAG: glycosyltransferase family 39 protein [Chloroflexota bacterium]|nr:glycosyltransferase family 39 protein [Chloroflexota bacterium]